MVDSGDPESDDDVLVIRRQKPKYCGVYVAGKIENQDIAFTVDTGATRTILSYKTYEKIPLAKRPDLTLKPSHTVMTNADGGKIHNHGKAVFQLQLGPLCFEKSLLVADIEDEVLLGADILQQFPTGPADLLLSENKLILDGVAIPVEQVGIDQQLRRLYSADHFIVPGLSEVIIDAFVERTDGEDVNKSCDLLLQSV